MQTEDELLSFMYACPFGLIELDEAGDIGMVNPHAMKHLLSLAGAHGVDNFFVATERYAPELRNFVDGFDEPDGTICDGHRIYLDLGKKNADGQPKVLACSLVKRAPNQLIATLSDISAQVVLEDRLNKADTWFSSLIDEVNDHALLTIDGDGVVLSANASFVRQTGYAANDAIGQPISSILSEAIGKGEKTLSIRDQLTLATRDGWNLFEGWEQRADGQRYWCQRLVVARAEDSSDDNPAFSLVLRDVSEPEENTDDLIALLTRDYLTGATNRMQFQKILKREYKRYLAHDHPLSLIMLDLDNFKALNDLHGHPAGDAVLKQVAETGLAAMPDSAVFARMGGEEFALLLPDCSAEAAAELAEDLRRRIAAQTIDTAGGPLQVTASLGCATMAETDGTTEDLIAIADRRLYAAKDAGRDQVASNVA